jgi:hypothetical protein
MKPDTVLTFHILAPVFYVSAGASIFYILSSRSIPQDIYSIYQKVIGQITPVKEVSKASSDPVFTDQGVEGLRGGESIIKVVNKSTSIKEIVESAIEKALSERVIADVDNFERVLGGITEKVNIVTVDVASQTVERVALQIVERLEPIISNSPYFISQRGPYHETLYKPLFEFGRSNPELLNRIINLSNLVKGDIQTNPDTLLHINNEIKRQVGNLQVLSDASANKLTEATKNAFELFSAHTEVLAALVQSL